MSCGNRVVDCDCVKCTTHLTPCQGSSDLKDCKSAGCTRRIARQVFVHGAEPSHLPHPDAAVVVDFKAALLSAAGLAIFFDLGDAELANAVGTKDSDVLDLRSSGEHDLLPVKVACNGSMQGRWQQKVHKLDVSVSTSLTLACSSARLLSSGLGASCTASAAAACCASNFRIYSFAVMPTRKWTACSDFTYYVLSITVMGTVEHEVQLLLRCTADLCKSVTLLANPSISDPPS
jgi:hypothetical protein